MRSSNIIATNKRSYPLPPKIESWLKSSSTLYRELVLKSCISLIFVTQLIFLKMSLSTARNGHCFWTKRLIFTLFHRMAVAELMSTAQNSITDTIISARRQSCYRSKNDETKESYSQRQQNHSDSHKKEKQVRQLNKQK